MFLTRREPGVPLSLFRSYPLPFSPPFLLYCSLITLPFLLCLFHWSITWSALVSFPTLSSSLFSSFSSILFLTLPFLLCLFHWSISAVVCSFRGGILSVVFPAVAICFWPAGNLECPCLFSDLILFPFLLLFFYIVPYPSFSSMSFSLIYICCSFRGGILSVVFPTVAICFWPAGNLECPCLFSDLILFPFLLLFFYIVPYPSFSSMSFSLIYICCSFRGGILSACFPHCSHMFLTRREPGVPLSLFRSYPLPFSPPFLLYCSLPFLFFYVFFIDLYLL